MTTGTPGERVTTATARSADQRSAISLDIVVAAATLAAIAATPAVAAAAAIAAVTRSHGHPADAAITTGPTRAGCPTCTAINTCGRARRVVARPTSSTRSAAASSPGSTAVAQPPSRTTRAAAAARSTVPTGPAINADVGTTDSIAALATIAASAAGPPVAANQADRHCPGPAELGCLPASADPADPTVSASTTIAANGVVGAVAAGATVAAAAGITACIAAVTTLAAVRPRDDGGSAGPSVSAVADQLAAVSAVSSRTAIDPVSAGSAVADQSGRSTVSTVEAITPIPEQPPVSAVAGGAAGAIRGAPAKSVSRQKSGVRMGRGAITDQPEIAKPYNGSRTQHHRAAGVGHFDGDCGSSRADQTLRQSHCGIAFVGNSSGTGDTRARADVAAGEGQSSPHQRCGSREIRTLSTGLLAEPQRGKRSGLRSLYDGIW
jgi:hypothetical protein